MMMTCCYDYNIPELKTIVCNISYGTRENQLKLFIYVVKEALNLPGIFEMHDMTYDMTFKMLYTIADTTTTYALQHPNVQKLIHSTDLEFDLVIGEQFYQEAFLMFGHKFNAPIITISKYLPYLQYFYYNLKYNLISNPI